MARPFIDNEAFRTAAVDFEVQAKTCGAELIGISYGLFFHRRGMSAVQIEIEMESIREALRSLNSSFAALERAHHAMTGGETASPIFAAAE